MKSLLLKLIDLYQKTPGHFHNKCRFMPTCSNYAKEAIEKYGVLKGGFMSIKRREEKIVKKIIILVFMTVILVSLTGCLKNDKMENIDIATTIYPINYVAERLYGSNSNIKSIYPKSSKANSYKITDKKLKDFSKYDLFIYNGTSKEREYATKMLNYNKNLKIIDASYGLDKDSSSDIWFNPSNVLMIGQNIKDSLDELISNPYLIKDLKNKYELLKVDITELETEFKKTADNSSSNTIVVADDSLNFIKKYGFEVINLTKNGEEKQANIEKAISLIQDGKIQYIFKIENSKNYEVLNNLKNNYDINFETLRSLDNITEEDESNNDDYLSLMHQNIDKIKKETYK